MPWAKVSIDIEVVRMVQPVAGSSPLGVGIGPVWVPEKMTSVAAESSARTWAPTPAGRRGRRPRMAQEVLELHVKQRRALTVVIGRGVEADIDAAAGSGNGGSMPFERRPVKDVELRDVRVATVPLDALRHLFQGRVSAPGEMHLGALAGVRVGDRRADCSGGAVDDRGLVVEQHRCRPFVVCRKGFHWSRRWGSAGGAASGRGVIGRSLCWSASMMRRIWWTYSMHPSHPSRCCWTMPSRSAGSAPSR